MCLMRKNSLCPAADDDGTTAEAETEEIMKVNVLLQQAGLNHSET